MNLESLKEKIKDFYDEGPEEVFYKVRSWLLSRGFDDDAFVGGKTAIKKSKLHEYRARVVFLDMLLDAGVDQWEGYQAVVDNFTKE